MACFVGTWKIQDQHHMEEFLKEYGAQEAVIQKLVQAKANVRVTISQHGEKFHVKHEGGLRNYEYDFEFGKEHVEELFGRQVTLSTKKESDTKIVHSGKGERGEIHIVRELVDGHMHFTAEVVGRPKKLCMKFERA